MPRGNEFRLCSCFSETLRFVVIALAALASLSALCFVKWSDRCGESCEPLAAQRGVTLAMEVSLRVGS